jgi:hypothetical protein
MPRISISPNPAKRVYNKAFNGTLNIIHCEATLITTRKNHTINAKLTPFTNPTSPGRLGQTSRNNAAREAYFLMIGKKTRKLHGSGIRPVPAPALISKRSDCPRLKLLVSPAM